VGIPGDGSREIISPGALALDGDIDLRRGHQGRPPARSCDGSLRVWGTEFQPTLPSPSRRRTRRARSVW
jgi:hypothetical protein